MTPHPKDLSCASNMSEAKHPNCFDCPGREHAEWCVLGEQGVALLDAHKVRSSYPAGSWIFEDGDACRGVFCVQEGEVALRKDEPGGTSALLRMIHGGETLGYRAYFAGTAHCAGAQALTDVEGCFVSRETLDKLLAANPALGHAFLHRLAGDLIRAEELRVQIAAVPVRTRLAHLLLVLRDRYGVMSPDDDLVISLPLSRRDIASLLGTRPETVSRAIRELEEAGAAVFDRRTVTVSDLDLLYDEIEPGEGP